MLRRMASPLLGLLLLACGDRSPLGALAEDEPSDAASQLDSGLTESGLPAGTTHLGEVAATGTAGGTSFASADFFRRDREPTACGLALPVGQCAVARCSTAANPRSENAGTIVASALGSTATLSYEGADPHGSYPVTTFPASVALAAGDTIQFAGAGGPDVPTFDVSVTMPVLGIILSPAFVDDEIIDTSMDLDVSWQSIPSGLAVFTVYTTMLGIERGFGLTCVFDGPSGSGVVPAADLQSIKDLSEGGEASVGFLAVSRTQVVAGDWAIEAIAAIGSGGPMAQFGPVTLK
jgi:hypothetical protein